MAGDSSRAKILVRSKRIAGQVAGIQRMIESDRYCIDILNQISAARSALDALGIELLRKHLESCLLGHGSRSASRKAKPMKPPQLLQELQVALARFLG
jgi:CsoR family transcriptional regulator, copper-sensing transcriptional repressor